MKNKLSHGARAYVVLIFIFLYLPIIVMALFSFNDSASTYIFTGFSVKWWLWYPAFLQSGYSL